MAAVAVVEGHYDHYQQTDTPLTPLAPFLLSEEWKEVVPMAAVLAKKQADPILRELVSHGKISENQFLQRDHTLETYEWSANYRMPAAISRLAQCLVEEAEFSPSTLIDTLHLVATFAHGCQSPDSWDQLGKGPFGEALYRTAWDLYKGGQLPKQAWMRNTVALLAAHCRTYEEWASGQGQQELKASLSSSSVDQKGWAAASICGLLWMHGRGVHERDLSSIVSTLQPLLEANLKADCKFLYEITAWALGLIQARFFEQNRAAPRLKPSTLAILVRSYFSNARAQKVITDFTLSYGLRFDRGRWKPGLTQDDVSILRRLLRKREQLDDLDDRNKVETALLLAYHHGDVVSENVLRDHLSEFRKRHANSSWLASVISELSPNRSITPPPSATPR